MKCFDKSKIDTKEKRFNKQKVDVISLDDKENKLELDCKAYQVYLINTSEELKKQSKEVSLNHLENIFTNEMYYVAMKKVPKLERKVLYLSLYEERTLKSIQNYLRLSKKNVIRLKENGIKHFKENVAQYQKNISNRNGGGINE